MRALISLICYLGLSNLVLATELINESPNTLGQQWRVSSEILQEEREILIYAATAPGSKGPYQVLYLLDAEYLFKAVLGIVDALVAANKMPPVVLVGVKTTVRARDYLPSITGAPKNDHQRWIAKQFPHFGGSEQFTRFLREELFPLIEKRYPVLPSRTLIGYSNGGVFGLHTLTHSPDLFNHYLLVSPAAWWSEGEISEHFQRFSREQAGVGKNLFLSIAGEGGRFYGNGLRIAATLEETAPSSLHWHFKEYPQETHQSTLYPAIYDGLCVLFADLKLEISDTLGKYAQVADIQSYYVDLSERYGVKLEVPASVFSDLADAQMALQRQQEALNTLKTFVATYPYNSFAHSSLAEGYVQVRQFALAKAALTQAIALVKEQGVKDPGVLAYLTDRYKRIEQQW